MNDVAKRNAKLLLRYSKAISSKIPEKAGLVDWMEDYLAVAQGSVSRVVHALRNQPNTLDNYNTAKYMAKANAGLLSQYSQELLDLLDSKYLQDWMHSKISVAASLIDDVYHALDRAPSYALTFKRPGNLKD